MQNAASFESLNIQGPINKHRVGEAYKSPDFCNLRSLTITNHVTGLGSRGWQNVAGLFDEAPNLRSLTMHRASVSRMNQLPWTSSLTKLHLHSCSFPSRDLLVILARAVNLQDLHIETPETSPGSCPPEDRFVEHLSLRKADIYMHATPSPYDPEIGRAHV